MVQSQFKKVSIYSDGGARGNPGPSAIGVLLLDDTGEEITRYQGYLGEATNNVAEYNGVLKGLELASQMEAKEVDFFLDSELVVRQLSGVYRVKHPKMLEMFKKVKLIEQKFEKIVYSHLPRTHPKIQIADLLVNQALDEELMQ